MVFASGREDDQEDGDSERATELPRRVSVVTDYGLDRETYTEDKVCNHDEDCCGAVSFGYRPHKTTLIPGPRFDIIFSLAASLALVEDAGYSPPTPCDTSVVVLHLI